MNGKKVAVIVVSVTLIASILVAIAMSVFFATYNPNHDTKETIEEDSEVIVQPE